jgi:rubredoxin
MKCLCGYHYEPEWNRETSEPYNGGEKEFIRIKGTVFAIPDYNGNYTKEVFLVACPECGTVRMERIW